MIDVVGAQFAIDLLGVIEEKTKGNLTDEESKELGEILAQLRARFVQIAKLVAAHQDDRKLIEEVFVRVLNRVPCDLLHALTYTSPLRARHPLVQRPQRPVVIQRQRDDIRLHESMRQP